MHPFLALYALVTLVPAAGADTVRVSEDIRPTAVTSTPAFSPLQAPEKLVNGSGLKGELHDEDSGASTMWHTGENPAPTKPADGLPAAPAWVRFEFKEPRTIDEIRVWNHNQAGMTDRGFRKTRVYGTADGRTWVPILASEPVELSRGGTKAEILSVRASKPLRGIILAAENNYGSPYYGLSEVRFAAVRTMSPDAAPFPTAIECEPRPYYRHRKDGKAGREITVKFNGGKLYGEATGEITVTGGPAETVPLEAVPNGADEVRLLLPDGVAVDREAQVTITLRRGSKAVSQQVMVPAKRRWTVYIYPHSHVDIGYTNTHENIEIIHKRNLVTGIELARKTADWPEGSRFVWNPEVTWPVERYLATATKEECEVVFDAIRKGWLCLDAGYINDNTSVACDEELFPYVAYKHKLEKATGVKIDSLVQVDVPGMSWGVVPAAAQNGIRHVLCFHNGGDRTGNANDLNFRPFWWESPDGKSRVLFYQAGSYNPGAAIKGMPYASAMMGQTNPDKLPREVRTNSPRANFADKYFLPATQLLESGSAKPYSLAPVSSSFLAYLGRMENTSFYPYDMFVMSWAMADNTPVDVDLPEAVRSWNEEYAYPRLIIAGTKTILSDFEKKYGDKIPVLRGDFTEYWTDGLGSAAKQTGMNRNSKERLIAADTLRSMLAPGKPTERADFDEAWRCVVLGSEHTWCFADPNRQPITNDILKVKFGYFQQAEDRSKELLARALAPVAAKEAPIIAVFNTLSWNRTELVTLSAEHSKGANGVRDEDGNVMPSQRLSTGELVLLAKDVPALGVKNYALAGGAATPAQAAKVDALTLDNGLVRVALDPKTGDIASLVMNGREFVDKQAACALNSYRYLRGNADGSTATGPTEVKITVKEKGPLVASLLVESKAEGCNTLVREVRIAAGSPEVACDNLVDKIATTAKEGVHFGFAFDLPGSRARMDIPWGVAEVERDQLKAGNRNWICFQRWLDVSNADAGVVWSALDAPTFEYGAMSANILGPALFSPQWLRELKPSSTIYSWALNNHWHTNFPLSQSGKIPFRYRMFPHAGGFDAAAANRFGTAQSQPLVVCPVKSKVSVTAPVQIDNPRVVVTIVRGEEDGSTTLRLRSLSEKEERVTLTLRPGASLAIVNGDGTTSATAPTLTLAPQGSLSLLLGK
jgi:alpha-mannosidase